MKWWKYLISIHMICGQKSGIIFVIKGFFPCMYNFYMHWFFHFLNSVFLVWTKNLNRRLLIIYSYYPMLLCPGWVSIVMYRYSHQFLGEMRISVAMWLLIQLVVHVPFDIRHVPQDSHSRVNEIKILCHSVIQTHTLHILSFIINVVWVLKRKPFIELLVTEFQFSLLWRFIQSIGCKLWLCTILIW